MILRITLLLGMTAGLAAGGWYWLEASTGASNPGESSGSERLLVVKTRSVQPRSSYTSNHRYVGRVEARRKTAAGFEIGGQLERVQAEEGQVVKQGEPLARLDTSRLEARLSERQAAVERAVADLSLAEITRDRMKKAHEQNVISRQKWDEARETHRVKKAVLGEARSRLETVRVDIRKSTLRAPFDAVVSRRYVDEGQVVSPGDPIVELFEHAAPEVRIGVGGRRASALKQGEKQTLRIHGKDHPARVKAVLPRRNPESRTVEVLFVLNQWPPHVRHGDQAVFRMLETNRRQGFWLPMNALVESARGLWACYVAKPPVDGSSSGAYTIIRRELELLHKEADRVYVRGTLQSGDRVVVKGIHRLTVGQSVRLLGGKGV